MRLHFLLPLVAAAAACAIAGIACLVATPPELPPCSHRPTILRDSALPPADSILTQWPTRGFLVPVQVQACPTEAGLDTFQWDVFVDYDPVFNPDPKLFPTTVSTGAVDGGSVTITFDPGEPDPGACHVVEFRVAHAFNLSSPHTPDSIGGDSVTWIYNAGGGPNGCPGYPDAGDGSFPPTDAGSDSLPVVPDSGTE